MKLSSSNIKKFLYFLKRKLFLYFWKWNPALFTPGSKKKKSTPGKSLILQETEAPKKLLVSSQKKAVLMFWQKGNPKNITCKA